MKREVGGADPGRVPKRDQGRVRVRAIHEELDRRCEPLPELAGEVRRDDQPDRRVAALQEVVELSWAPGPVAIVEILRPAEAGSQFAARWRAIQVLDRQREMGHVVRDAVRAQGDLDRDCPDDEDDQRLPPEELEKLLPDQRPERPHGQPIFRRNPREASARTAPPYPRSQTALGQSRSTHLTLTTPLPAEPLIPQIRGQPCARCIRAAP